MEHSGNKQQTPTSSAPSQHNDNNHLTFHQLRLPITLYSSPHQQPPSKISIHASQTPPNRAASETSPPAPPKPKNNTHIKNILSRNVNIHTPRLQHQRHKQPRSQPGRPPHIPRIQDLDLNPPTLPSATTEPLTRIPWGPVYPPENRHPGR